MNICDKTFKSVSYSVEKGRKMDFSNKPRPIFTIAYFIGGSADFIENNNRITLSEDEILIIPKDSVYISEWNGAPTTDYYALHFDFPNFQPPFGDKMIKIQKICNLHNLKKHFVYIHENKNNDENIFEVMKAFYEICDIVYQNMIFGRKKALDSRITAAINFIEENYASQITVEQLSSICYMSQSHFHSRFKRSTGMSPIDYKLRVSVSHACDMLSNSTDMSIADISETLGFHSESYFRRIFKKFTGYSPREFQKNNFIM